MNNLPIETHNTKETLTPDPIEPVDVSLLSRQFRDTLRPEHKQILDIEMFKFSGENYPKSIDALEMGLNRIIEDSNDGDEIFVRVAAMFFVNYPFFTSNGK